MGTSPPSNATVAGTGLLWLILNIALVIWAYYYVDAHLKPLAHQSLIDSHGWGAFNVFLIVYDVLIFLFDCWLGLIVCATTFDLLQGSKEKNDTVPMITKIAKVIVLITVWASIFFFCLAVAVAPFVAIPLAWKQEFKHSCDGFNIRVLLDSPNQFPASTISFQQTLPFENYSMTIAPNPQLSNNVYNTFSLDPGYTPGSTPFLPDYDQIHYNLSSNTYTLSLNSSTLHTGSFTLAPTLSVPDLNITADSSAFLKAEFYAAFFKAYSTDDPEVLSKPYAWSDNTDVVLRTAKSTLSSKAILQVCARGQEDSVKGLGNRLPVVTGLLILLRDRRKIVYPSGYIDG
jgi:hypothetical protein